MFKEYLTYRRARKVLMAFKRMKLPFGWEIVYKENLKSYSNRRIEITYKSHTDMDIDDLVKVLTKVMELCVKFSTHFFSYRYEKKFSIEIDVK